MKQNSSIFLGYDGVWFHFGFSFCFFCGLFIGFLGLLMKVLVLPSMLQNLKRAHLLQFLDWGLWVLQWVFSLSCLTRKSKNEFWNTGFIFLFLFPFVNAIIRLLKELGLLGHQESLVLIWTPVDLKKVKKSLLQIAAFSKNKIFMMTHSYCSTAKKFGVTEFVNPKDHKKPIQEVGFVDISLSWENCQVNKILEQSWILLIRWLLRWPTEVSTGA